MTRAVEADWSAFSGRQIQLSHGRQRAVVVEVGAALREYQVDGLAVLDGFAVDRMPDGGRGQPLLPWPNRIQDGQYTFDGRQLQLPIDEVARRSATHGLTRWLNWHAAEQTPDRVTMTLVLHPRPGYPFTLELAIDYSLTDDGLRVRTTARNLGGAALPFGAGQHPYFSVGTQTVDSAALQLPARTRLELDTDRRLPTGTTLATAGSAYDFGEPRPIGALVLDDCFTELTRDDHGIASVRLADPNGERQAVVWMDAHYQYVQVFSGDTLAPDRRRRGLAIEPMTCPPNAFRTGTDVVVLQPDQAIALEWGLRPTPSS
jgi:aldose 1-epimerase